MICKWAVWRGASNLRKVEVFKEGVFNQLLKQNSIVEVLGTPVSHDFFRCTNFLIRDLWRSPSESPSHCWVGRHLTQEFRLPNPCYLGRGRPENTSPPTLGALQYVVLTLGSCSFQSHCCAVVRITRSRPFQSQQEIQVQNSGGFFSLANQLSYTYFF